jgi:regulator of protease activity HflC (stomatin/prohibitin superfamily)
MIMNKLRLIIPIVLLIILVVAGYQGCNRVEPNYEGVLMTNYGRNGKTDFRRVTGTQNTMWFGTSLYQVPMYALNGNPDAITVTAKDGGVFTVDPQYTYQAKRDSGINIIFNYKYLGLAGQLGEDDLNNVEASVLNPIVLNAYREEARNFATDSLLTSINLFENNVEARLKQQFAAKYFDITSLTSGLKPPASMTENIERMNNAKVETQTVKNQLATAKMLQEKASIEAKTNEIKSRGFTKEILAEKWIDAIRNSSNRIIITDGKTPIMVN